MAPPYMLALRGELVVVGKRPDGDSIRFLPSEPARLEELERADRLRPSRDGTVQTRLEGVDAPETHYGDEAQPLGDEARDRLLHLAGFERWELGASGTVLSAEPATRPAVVLAARVEPNGRPVSYLLPGDGALGTEDRWVRVDRELLGRTVNGQLVADGSAYLTVYTSTPLEHRRVLRELAAGARRSQLGVWALDASDEFTLNDQASISPGGQLILPKLFRRCTDYLRAVDQGFAGTLADWLVAVSASGARDEDDRLLIEGGVEVNLSALVEQRNRRIRFRPDLLDIVFVDK